MGVLVGAVLCSAAPVRAQNVNARLDQVIRFYSDDRKSFMGTVLVARDGKPVLSAGYGFANLEWSVPNAPGTKFRIGSLTGHFTAAAVLLLEQLGKLRVDDPLKKYLPDIPAAWGAITLQHLLADTSGIPDYTEVPEYRTARLSAMTPDKLLALVRDRPLEFAPGERFNRSNSGYLLLGFAIEKAAGVPYQRFVREGLLTPAGMGESGFEAGNAVVTRRASGYALSSAGLANTDLSQMALSNAAGGLFSTSGDLLKWTQALFSGKILSAASLQKMTTTVRDHHALGVTSQTTNNRRVVSGSGASEGFAAVFDFYPESRTTVIVLSNLEGTVAGEMAAQLGAVAQGDEVRLTYRAAGDFSAGRDSQAIRRNLRAGAQGEHHDWPSRFAADRPGHRPGGGAAVRGSRAPLLSARRRRPDRISRRR